MNADPFSAEWRVWIASRLTRIERPVPRFTTATSYHKHGANGQPYPAFFVFGHWGPICSVHDVFCLN